MQNLRNLELHVVHSCNLACESCSHYSNQGHRGSLAIEEADAWMAPWKSRLSPQTFSLLGGEPTIHPDLPRFLTLVRKHWPDTHLRLVTNGFFLHRHPELPEILKRDRNACIYLSLHHDSPEYQQKLRPHLQLLGDWVRRHGIRVQLYRSFEKWTRRYHGFGNAMEPFRDEQPRQSWEHCPARYCPQLFDGNIWKCGPLAYLSLQAAKYRLSESWTPYLQYRPLTPDCTNEQLVAFFQREEESHCGMCPANPERFKLPIPTIRPAARAAEATDQAT